MDTETYPPRSFTFNVKWQIQTYVIEAPPFRSVADQVSTPLLPLMASASRSFRVPDDDNDSSSDISQADSLAIVDSHPRTFSVPSSDDEADDDACIALESNNPNKGPTKNPCDKSTAHVEVPTLDKGKENANSMIDTASDQSRESSSGAIGASQTNPIDLDHNNRHAIDLDSDDDGPDVLPIDHSSVTNTGKKPLEAFENPQDAWSVHPDPGVDSSVSQYDEDDDFFRDLENVQVRDTPQVNDHLNNTQTLEQRSPEADVEARLCSSKSRRHAEDTFIKEALNQESRYLGAIDINRSKPGESFTSVQRTLSPSDAALAKKPIAPANSKLFEINSGKSQQGLYTFNGLDIPKPTTSNTPSYYFYNHEMDQLKFTREQQARTQAQYHTDRESSRGWESTKRNEPDRSESRDIYRLAPLATSRLDNVSVRKDFSVGPSPVDDFVDTQAPPKPYSVGPFSTLPYPGTPEDYVFPETYAGHKGPMWPDKSRPFSNHHRQTDGNDYRSLLPSMYKAAYPYEDSWKASNEVLPASEPYSPPPPAENPWINQTYSAYENPPRVAITDLVNPSAPGPAPAPVQAPALPASRGKKRKADEVTVGEPLQASNNSFVQPNAEESQMSVALPDAQPREQSVPVDTALTQEDTVSQTAQEPARPQDPQPSENRERALSNAEGPARKKVKTSPSKAAGIGKFVSGIAVGVVGVLATFIATIPASVREEALREINNVH